MQISGSVYGESGGGDDSTQELEFLTGKKKTQIPQADSCTFFGCGDCEKQNKAIMNL